jgi:uncharacterized membrane protein YeaQ/YmgE (transglycosylase-associated protein family)
MIGRIIGLIVVGLVIGALGRLVHPGKDPIPIWLTIVIGVAAAIIAGLLISGLLGFILLAVIIAAVLVVLLSGGYRAATR